jgi:AcrR family transcriptional regulator
MKDKAKPPRFRRVSPDERRARLIEASLACLAKGGIQAFTVDNICRETGTSRGLIAHHFGSKESLLAAVYAAVYDRLLVHLVSSDDAPDMASLIEFAFSTSNLNRENLNIWLALWGEISTNPALQAEHRKHYALYRERVARAISHTARTRGAVVDSYELATVFISLVDGLWLEQCIDPSLLSAKRAKEVCYRVMEASLGPIRPAASHA